MRSNVRRRIAMAGAVALIAVLVGRWAMWNPTRWAITVENGTGTDLEWLRVGPEGGEISVGRLGPGEVVERRFSVGSEQEGVNLNFLDGEGFQSGSSTFVIPHLRSMRYRITLIRTEGDVKEYRIQAVGTTMFDIERFARNLLAGRLDGLGTSVACPTVSMSAFRVAANPTGGVTVVEPVSR